MGSVCSHVSLVTESHWVGRARHQCWITTAASVSAKSVLEPHRCRAELATAGYTCCPGSNYPRTLHGQRRAVKAGVYYVLL